MTGISMIDVFEDTTTTMPTEVDVGQPTVISLESGLDEMSSGKKSKRRGGRRGYKVRTFGGNCLQKWPWRSCVADVADFVALLRGGLG